MRTERLVAFCVFAVAVAGVSANPVVWLHGWNSNGSSWRQFQEQMVSNGVASADDFLTADYYAKEMGFSPDTPIEEIAEAVACDIQDFYDARKDGAPLDVVCHSMGGLVFRSMIANECLVDNSILRRYVTLGTPHYGQNLGITYQARQMVYGSGFLWRLGEAWHFQGKCWPATNALCIAGMTDAKSALLFSSSLNAPGGSYWDGLVHAWSASLGKDVPVRYVYRSHSSSLAQVKAPPLCALVDGEKDVVYRLVEDFLVRGTVPESRTPTYGGVHDGKIGKWVEAEQGVGAVFLQVCSAADGKPLAYGNPIGVSCRAVVTQKKFSPLKGMGLESEYSKGLAQLQGNFSANDRLTLTIKRPDGEPFKVKGDVSPSPASCRFLKVRDDGSAPQ